MGDGEGTSSFSHSLLMPILYLPSTEAMTVLVTSSGADSPRSVPYPWLPINLHSPQPVLSLGTSSVLGPELGDRMKQQEAGQRAAREPLYFSPKSLEFSKGLAYLALKNCLLVVSPGSLSVEAGHWTQGWKAETEEGGAED